MRSVDWIKPSNYTTASDWRGQIFRTRDHRISQRQYISSLEYIIFRTKIINRYGVNMPILRQIRSNYHRQVCAIVCAMP